MPQEPVPVMADMTRLSQVFANLLNNAAKYTPPGGRIDIDIWEKDDVVSVAVKDNGIGIKEEKRDFIFEMFTQVNDSGINTYGGLGIGLTLVKNFVQMHGGSIDIHSEGIGKGSTFTVNLPVYNVQGMKAS
jgi:signal transduction histidine kinase